MKELFKSITQSEWRFIILMSLVLVIITGVPYLYAYLVAPAGFSYNGLTSLTPADNPVYYSYINQVKQGNFLINYLFTTEPEPFGMFNVFWLVTGLIAKVFLLPPALAFHFVRLFLIPVFIVAVYCFIGLFFSEPKKRKFCLFFLLFSAGLGVYFLGQISAFDLADKPGYWTPNDIWIPESIVFLTLYKTPHFIASLTLMIAIFGLMIFSFLEKRLSYVLTAGVLALVYFNFHPFYIPMVFATLGLYLFFLILKNRKILWLQAGYFMLFIIISSPAIFYHFWVLANNPIMALRASQNITIAPPFIFIIIGYGFLWPLAVLGIIWLIKRRELNHYFLFLLSWLLVSVALVNFPIQFQSRYTQGLHLPLAIVSVVALFFLVDKFLTPKNLDKYGLWLGNQYLAVMIFIVILAASNIFNLTRDIYYFSLKPEPVLHYFYLSQNEIAAIKHLATLVSNQQVLANDQVLSLFIPGLANQAVYLAHEIETVDYPVKAYFWQWFFGTDKQDVQKQEFLVKNGIDYLFFSQSKKTPANFNPAVKNYLQLVYRNAGVEIYQVTQP